MTDTDPALRAQEDASVDIPGAAGVLGITEDQVRSLMDAGVLTPVARDYCVVCGSDQHHGDEHHQSVATASMDGPYTRKPHDTPFTDWTVLPVDDFEGNRWWFHVPTAALAAAEAGRAALASPDTETAECTGCGMTREACRRAKRTHIACCPDCEHPDTETAGEAG